MAADTVGDGTKPGARVEDVDLWYHTIDLPGGVVTPGWFDLRSIVDKFPWPDVKGKRCLDVGTYDGFLAFELERRGASEVVALDIADHDEWDWPARARARGPETLAQLAGEKGHGFEVARELLGSRVEKRALSVYKLSPEQVGTFDVVVCGSLMLHLRDPVRALENIRRVCSGEFMSLEEISLRYTLLQRHAAIADARFSDELCQWWVFNAAGHKRVLQVAGFDLVRSVGPYSEPFGTGHTPRPGRLRKQAIGAVRRLTTGNDGIPHHAVLCRPGVDAPPIRV
jgi:tRNA (mo5U34)-methyltransferase